MAILADEKELHLNVTAWAAVVISYCKVVLYIGQIG